MRGGDVLPGTNITIMDDNIRIITFLKHRDTVQSRASLINSFKYQDIKIYLGGSLQIGIRLAAYAE
jgi:hypothetical protein